jgi:hypothetical protein
MGNADHRPLEPGEIIEAGVWFKGLGTGHFEMVGLVYCTVLRDDGSTETIPLPIPYISFDIDPHKQGEKPK